MKRVFSFFLFSFLMSLVALAQDPQGVKNIDLPDMYRQIDEAISQSPRYIADYEEKISKAKQALETANEEQRLMQLMEISRMYESFCGDSAQVYTERALELARQGGYNEIEGECMARLAYLCTFCLSRSARHRPFGGRQHHAGHTGGRGRRRPRGMGGTSAVVQWQGGYERHVVPEFLAVVHRCRAA